MIFRGKLENFPSELKNSWSPPPARLRPCNEWSVDRCLVTTSRDRTLGVPGGEGSASREWLSRNGNSPEPSGSATVTHTDQCVHRNVWTVSRGASSLHTRSRGTRPRYYKCPAHVIRTTYHARLHRRGAQKHTICFSKRRDVLSSFLARQRPSWNSVKVFKTT